MRHRPWLETGTGELIGGLQRLLPDALRPLMLSTYATETWLHAGLIRAGFALADTVIYYRLDLPPQDAPSAPNANAAHPAGLHLAQLGETQALAEMDAKNLQSTLALWRGGDYGNASPRPCHDSHGEGRASGLFGAARGPRARGAPGAPGCTPRWQRTGIGRQLLTEVVHYAQNEGFSAVALNTQASNLRSQTLYASLGFAPSGIEIPILTYQIN